MGAQQFFDTYAFKKGLEADFLDCATESAWYNGHGGYTGTIAEKEEAVDLTHLIPIELRDIDHMGWLEGGPYEKTGLSDEVLEQIEEATHDKWGPAGAILNRDGTVWFFFGWASS